MFRAAFEPDGTIIAWRYDTDEHWRDPEHGGTPATLVRDAERTSVEYQSKLSDEARAHLQAAGKLRNPS